MNLKEALEIIVVPEERYAQLRINRGDAQELWELLERLHAAELEGEESNRDRIAPGKMYAWSQKTIGIAVPEPEETPQITALDRDGVYTTPWLTHEERERRWGPYRNLDRSESGWFLVGGQTDKHLEMKYVNAALSPYQYGRGPLSEREALSLSQQATEAQEPEIQEATS